MTTNEALDQATKIEDAIRALREALQPFCATGMTDDTGTLSTAEVIMADGQLRKASEHVSRAVGFLQGYMS